MILDKINESKDIKSCSTEELKTLASEIRELIIKKVNTIGGHLGPNLGIVEATIAMHYVFNSPIDKIVFDVSHQCYPHKILTGRKEGFTNPDNYLKYTGYTAPEESVHDLFKVGHTSTSVSLATGVAKARDLKCEKYNVIALIGDGSLTGGEAFEGLNNAAILNSNIIIVVNDNEMSIAENFGGLYAHLKELRETNGTCENNFFKTLGFDYCYVEEGNSTEKLIEVFEKVKDINHPIVVHIHTQKGKGCEIAEKNKERFHWMLPGEIDRNDFSCNSETYTSITNEIILEEAKKDKTIVAVNAATPGVFGFTKEFREKLGSQYVDVGIAEEHAVAYCSAIAKQGCKPILSIMSSFLQRTYDQISQDLCLNNSPITMLVHWGGISPADCTHLGSFDIPFLSNIPNIIYLAPTCEEEYEAMLKWSIKQTKYPVAIRVPFSDLTLSGKLDNTDYNKINKFELVEEGCEIAIIGVGTFYRNAKLLKEYLKSSLNIDSSLINPKFLTGIDNDLLNSLKENHKIVITLEDGVLDGGFGEKISRFYSNTNIKVLNYGAKKEFTDRVPLDELYKMYRLNNEQILEDIKSIM